MADATLAGFYSAGIACAVVVVAVAGSVGFVETASKIESAEFEITAAIELGITELAAFAEFSGHYDLVHVLEIAQNSVPQVGIVDIG